MSNWREQILREFAPNVARLTLVADPDGLLTEEGVLAGIRERGFELIPFEDHIAFRYAYESRFRSRWDQGEQTDLVVVLRSGAGDLGCLPYDLLQAGRQLSFNLGEIFPNLSYPIVTALDRGDLDALYDAQVSNAPGVLGDNATKEFILRHVFEIAPELIKRSSDLLRVLLRRHYRGQRIPSLLGDRLVQVLRQQHEFEDWPLEKIIPDREAFFAFLQERWPVFLSRSAKRAGSEIRESDEIYGFEFPGPRDLPFDHDDIRVYIDNLFLEGFLEGVPHEHAEALSETWLSIGIRTEEKADRRRRMDGLLDTLESEVPKGDARHDAWFHFARTWAELIALSLLPGVTTLRPVHQRMAALQTQIDAALVPWLAKRYAGLVNLPPVPPVMLHHIPRFLSRYLGDDRKNKVALVVVDGLSLDQWVVIRRELAKKCLRYRFHENAVFAWIPTITSVSRQAAFAGKPPIYFPNSINTTNKESALWTQFWVGEGLRPQEVAYAKGLGGGTLEKVEEIVAGPKPRAVGLVVDTVDKMMHGMELGTSGMHNQVGQWAGESFMAYLFDLLIGRGFHVYLTSDHGNIEATGCGRPAEGSVVDQPGQRARVYSDLSLRRQVKELFPDALEWPQIGLPEGYMPLLAPGRLAFASQNEHLVGHGGPSLEEIVVPFVHIEERNA